MIHCYVFFSTSSLSTQPSSLLLTQPPEPQLLFIGLFQQPPSCSIYLYLFILQLKWEGKIIRDHKSIYRDCNFQEEKMLSPSWYLSSRTFDLGPSQFRQAIPLIFFTGCMFHVFWQSPLSLTWLPGLGRALSLASLLSPPYHSLSVTLDAVSIAQRVRERQSGMPLWGRMSDMQVAWIGRNLFLSLRGSGGTRWTLSWPFIFIILLLLYLT